MAATKQFDWTAVLTPELRAGLIQAGYQFDAQDRPFTINAKGQKSYLSPVTMFGYASKPEDTTGIFHKAPEWDTKTGEWVTPFDWGNVLNIGVAAGLGAGAAGAAGVGGAAPVVGPAVPADISPAAVAGTTVGGTAAGGGAAAAGGGTAAGTAAGGAGAGTAAAASTPLWKDILKVGIPVGAQVGADIYNTKTQADANQKAIDAQAKAAEDALAFTKEQYADLRRRRAPFESASLGSLRELYKRMGLGDITIDPVEQAAIDRLNNTTPAGSTQPKIGVGNGEGLTTTPGGEPLGGWNATTPVTDAQGRRIYLPANPKNPTPSATMPPMGGGTLNSLAPPTNTTAQVRMRAPDGSVGMIPQDKVTQAVAAGGVLL